MSTDYEIPEPRGSDVKEVYAFYGLAAYMSQVVEKALVSLLSVLEAEGLAVTRAEYDALFSRVDARTFGQLLRRAKTLLSLSPDVEAVLARALETRNHLAHQFFADHAAAFTTDVGRVQMIKELRGTTELFHRAEDIIAVVFQPLMKRRGMTPESLEQVKAEMVAAFLAKVEAAQPEEGSSNDDG